MYEGLEDLIQIILNAMMLGGAITLTVWLLISSQTREDLLLEDIKHKASTSSEYTTEENYSRLKENKILLQGSGVMSEIISELENGNTNISINGNSIENILNGNTDNAISLTPESIETIRSYLNMNGEYNKIYAYSSNSNYWNGRDYGNEAGEHIVDKDIRLNLCNVNYIEN